jgi:RNA polymerase sigma factor (sigma-70 family)
MRDTDLELLARYARHHAEEAFAEIVRRHLNLVFSAALRQVRSTQLAEEVAQTTFISLARDANRLAPDTVLSAWLYQVAHRTGANVVRRESRRQLREQIATEMNAMNATASDWAHIEPLLDEAMHALDETDRTAVLLRYFENKSLREVGATLGTSENAAQKRLGRAVERLREFFAKRGVAVGASGLVIVISANAVQAAPAGLAGTLSIAATGTATKAIVITAMQKGLIAVVAAAVVGAGFYVARMAVTAATPAHAQNAVAKRPASFAELSDGDIPGLYKWIDVNRTSLIVLHEDHTFMNKEGSTFPNYRWEKLSDRLVINWAKSTTEFTNFEAPGIYSLTKARGITTRLEKQSDPTPFSAKEASILFSSTQTMNGLTPVNSAEGGIYPGGKAGGMKCFRMITNGIAATASVSFHIGVEFKTHPLSNVVLAIEYFDSPAPPEGTNGCVWIEYDALKGPYTRADQRGGSPLRLAGSMTWKEATFLLDAPLFHTRQEFLGDFRLRASRGELLVRSLKLVESNSLK